MGSGSEATDATTGPSLVTLDRGPSTGGTTNADETTGMGLDGPVTTGVDDGQTTGECVSQSPEPDLQLWPVDVLIVIDTSNSMADAIAAVEASINDDFAAILAGSSTCATVQADPGAQLDVRFGCDVGFEPAG
jgi:hypothetical protein